MQNFALLVPFFFTSIAALGNGYSYQPPIQVSQNRRPHTVYGVPPSSIPYTEHKTNAHTFGTLGRNHGHRLPTSNIGANGKPHHYHGPKYLPPPATSHSESYHQPHRSVSGQQYGDAVDSSNIAYTPHNNPLLATQYSQPSPPISLTPPPLQTTSNHGSYQQQQPQSFGLSQSVLEQNNGFGTSGSASNTEFNLATQFQSTGNSVNEVGSNYISQAEVGQLDHYFEKQNTVGDVRAYSRVIHTCHADGRCEQQQLNPGQVDPRYQKIALMARGHLQPISDKCRALSAQGAAVGTADPGSLNASNALQAAQNSPPNRRRYQYTEAVIPRDQFN